MKQTKYRNAIDIPLFVLHLLLCGAMFIAAYLLSAPFFGAAPTAKESWLSFGFAALGLVVFIANLVWLLKRTKRLRLVVVFFVLVWMVLWCILESSLDMKFILGGYLVLVFPLLMLDA